MFSLMLSTRGDFTYLRPTFLIECEKEQKLLDPAAYTFTDIDLSKFNKTKTNNKTKFMERQRSTPGQDDNSQIGLATSLIRRRKRKQPPSSKRTREEINLRKLTQSRLRRENKMPKRTPLQQEIFDFRRKFAEEEGSSSFLGNTSFKERNIAFSVAWRAHLVATGRQTRREGCSARM